MVSSIVSVRNTSWALSVRTSADDIRTARINNVRTFITAPLARRTAQPHPTRQSRARVFTPAYCKSFRPARHLAENALEQGVSEAAGRGAGADRGRKKRGQEWNRLNADER